MTDAGCADNADNDACPVCGQRFTERDARYRLHGRPWAHVRCVDVDGNPVTPGAGTETLTGASPEAA